MHRRDVPVAIAAFLTGLILAAAAVAGWMFVATSGTGPVTVVDETVPTREAGGARGEIANADRTIADRLAAARAPSRPLRGGIGIRAGDIRWTDGTRRPLLSARSVTGVLDVAAVEAGDIVIDRVGVTGAEVQLQQDRNGAWNYERVLADVLKGEAEGGPRNTVVLTNVSVRDTRVEVRQPDRDIALENVVADLSRVQLSSPASAVPELHLRSVATTFTDLRKEESLAVRAEDARVRLPEERVEFVVARANVGTTRLADLRGSLRPAAGPRGIDITGRALDVHLSELAFLNERIPKEGRGSFRFAVRPARGDLLEVRLTEANVTAEGSHVRGSVAVLVGEQRLDVINVDLRLDPLALGLVERMSGRDLPYAGTLRGTVRGTGERLGFNVVATLTSEESRHPFVANLSGNVRLTGGTFELRTVTANLDQVPAEALRAFAPGLPFRGLISGTVSLTGPPDRAPLNLNVRLDVAGGVAIVNGTLDLTGAEPVYDVTGRLIGVNLDQLLEPKAPPAALTARFVARGRGFKPETADARLGVVGRFTGWRTEPHDTVIIAAHVRNGGVALDSGLVNLGPFHVETRGEWRFVAPETGALTYRFDIDNLALAAPYIPLLPDTAAGKLQGSGSIAGSLERMRIDGDMRGEGVKLARWQTARVEAKHRLVLGGPVPEIEVEANATEIATPTTGAYKSLAAKVRLVSPEFALDVHADRTQGGVIEVAATGQVPYEGARRVDLQRARMDLGTGTWTLVNPATVDWGTPDGVRVRNFTMRAAEGEGLLSLDGTVLPLEKIDARIETAALPLDEIQTLLGRPQVVTGLLWAKGEVRGPGTAPTFNLTFRVERGTYEEVRFTRLEGSANYARQVLNANAVAAFDTAGRLDARATLPMQIAFEPEVKIDLLDSGPARASLVADSVALAAFAGFMPDVRDVQGVVRANASVTGTVAAPNLSGSVSIAGGAATIIPLNRRYTDFNADIGFDGRSAVMRTFSLRSGGTATVSGRIEFPELSNPTANLTATLDRFRPAGVDDHPDAAASGEVHINGPVSALTVTGSLMMEDGDVPIPTLAQTALDDQLSELVGPIEVPTPGHAHRHDNLFENVRVRDLRFTAGEALWFNLPNARAQLSGELTVNKIGEEMSVVGTLEGNRGTYTLEAGPILRRFEVTRAELRFLGGPEINPALDITARRLILDASGRDMEVEIRVGGTMKSPTLQLASQDAALIPQSELLSYLLFGQPTLGLSGGGLPGQALLEETLLGGITELASLELESAIGGGFDIFQIRLRGSGLEGIRQPTLVLGREVTSDVFLTVESGIAALFGPAESENLGNTVAVRLEWRIDPRTSLRAGYEPVNRRGVLRGIGVALPLSQRRQVGLELRRRWMW